MNIQFGSRNSRQSTGFLHQLDPRIKILSFIFFILTIAFTPANYHVKFLVYFFLIVFFITFSRISIGSIGKRLLLLFPLLVFLFFTVILFKKNQSLKDLDVFWNLFIKSILIFLSFLILTLTSEIYSLIKGLAFLRCPKIVTSLLTFSHCYVFLFIKEFESMRIAKVSRSYSERRIIRDIKTIIKIIPHFFFRVLERSEQIYAGMLSRGYDKNIKSIGSLYLKKTDVIFALFFNSFLFMVVFVL